MLRNRMLRNNKLALRARTQVQAKNWHGSVPHGKLATFFSHALLCNDDRAKGRGIVIPRMTIVGNEGRYEDDVLDLVFGDLLPLETGPAYFCARSDSS